MKLFGGGTPLLMSSYARRHQVDSGDKVGVFGESSQVGIFSSSNKVCYQDTSSEIRGKVTLIII